MKIFLSSFFSFTFEPNFSIFSQLTTLSLFPKNQYASHKGVSFIHHALTCKWSKSCSYAILCLILLGYNRIFYSPKSLDSLALPLVWQLYRPACRNLHLVMLSHSFQLNAGISGQWATLKTNYTALKSNISILWCYINTHCSKLSILLIIIFKFMIRHKETACKVIALNSNW